MALELRMTVDSVEYRAGQVCLPLCQAVNEKSYRWPPRLEQLSISRADAIPDHVDCLDCAQVSDDLVWHLDDLREGDRVYAAFMVGVREEVVRLRLVEALEDNPNRDWSSDPKGGFELTIDRPERHGYLKPGAEYVLEVRTYMPRRSRKDD